MSKSTIKAVQIILLSSVVFLAGCNAPIAQPTLDPNMIYTAAAQTVQAQLAVASAGTATAAAVPPTQAAPTQAPTAKKVGTLPKFGWKQPANLLRNGVAWMVEYTVLY